MESRLRLGELLVCAGLVAQSDLDRVLAVQTAEGRRLGSLLVAHGLLTETQVTQILSQQLSVPWVSLQHVSFSADLLGFVPAVIAQRYTLIPIYVRRLRGKGDVLYIAMDDPVNDEALAEVERCSGMPVRPMIASPSDIRNAIHTNYGTAREVGELSPDSAPPSSMIPSLLLDSAPPSSLELEALSSRRTVPLTRIPTLSITFPDGTSRELPANFSAAASERWQNALGSAAPANETVDWEKFSAGLLSWLEANHLIASWELKVDEDRQVG
jgi:Type II secretion system (T2SS), protein E, N-terminal domain